jgi:hypothetical protein
LVEGVAVDGAAVGESVVTVGTLSNSQHALVYFVSMDGLSSVAVWWTANTHRFVNWQTETHWATE